MFYEKLPEKTILVDKNQEQDNALLFWKTIGKVIKM